MVIEIFNGVHEVGFGVDGGFKRSCNGEADREVLGHSEGRSTLSEANKKLRYILSQNQPEEFAAGVLQDDPSKF